MVEGVYELSKEELQDCITTYITPMMPAKDRFIKFKFLHKAYNTSWRLANIYPTVSPMCTRCNSSTGMFIHLVWSCYFICPFWESVAGALPVNYICDLTFQPIPLFLLLGIIEDVVVSGQVKLLTFIKYL